MAPDKGTQISYLPRNSLRKALVSAMWPKHLVELSLWLIRVDDKTGTLLIVTNFEFDTYLSGLDYWIDLHSFWTVKTRRPLIKCFWSFTRVSVTMDRLGVGGGIFFSAPQENVSPYYAVGLWLKLKPHPWSAVIHMITSGCMVTMLVCLFLIVTVNLKSLCILLTLQPTN